MIRIDGFDVRELSVADQPAIDDLFARSADFTAVDPHARPDHVLHHLPADAVPEREHSFGFFREGQLLGIMGMLCGYREEKDWWIGLLLLDPSLRGEGIGHAAVEEAMRWARASNVARAMWLVVAFDNTRAQKFWQREGFVERGRTETHLMLSRAID